MKLRDWVTFWTLGLIWGSSFLWIKIALDNVGPFTLVAWRLLIGVAGLALVVLFRRPTFPRGLRIYGLLALLGVTNTALPFLLISWGEQSIDSAVASILNGTVPLFAMVFAHFALQDDRMTRARVAGLILGFLGVIVLMSGDLVPGEARAGGLGQLAVLVASILYAFRPVHLDRGRRHRSAGAGPDIRADLVRACLARAARIVCRLPAAVYAAPPRRPDAHDDGDVRFPGRRAGPGDRLFAGAGYPEPPDRGGDGGGRDPGGERFDAAAQPDGA
ncbi:MAG: putative membrane protein [Anaerolineales bacterium]|nr:putative membrane protein [Anaerolineales bacterium]